jgi:hypothetical protein
MVEDFKRTLAAVRVEGNGGGVEGGKEGLNITRFHSLFLLFFPSLLLFYSAYLFYIHSGRWFFCTAAEEMPSKKKEERRRRTAQGECLIGNRPSTIPHPFSALHYRINRDTNCDVINFSAL